MAAALPMMGQIAGGAAQLSQSSPQQQYRPGTGFSLPQFGMSQFDVGAPQQRFPQLSTPSIPAVSNFGESDNLLKLLSSLKG
jgi:hypothetical protein